MTFTNQNRVSAGIPTGGEFAAHDRADGDIQLPAAPTGHRIPVEGYVTIGDAGLVYETYPTELPEPEVSYELEDGAVHTYITVGDQTFKFHEHQGERCNDVYTSEAAPFPFIDDDAVREEVTDHFVEWAEQVHNQLDCDVYAFTLKAADIRIQSAIVAAALGKPVTVPTYDEDANGTQILRGLDANVRADGTIEVLAYRGTEHDTDASAVTPLTAEQARALAAELIAAAEESEAAER